MPATEGPGTFMQSNWYLAYRFLIPGTTYGGRSHADEPDVRHDASRQPKEAQADSHALLLRAAFIRQLGAGLFSLMPLGKRSITKIENIIRKEMDSIHGQEITMPVVNPGEVWKESGRWYQVGSEMSRFVDRVGRDMCLAMTHEEVMTTLIRSDVRSYKQLPMMVYHIQTKWRDDPGPGPA